MHNHKQIHLEHNQKQIHLEYAERSGNDEIDSFLSQAATFVFKKDKDWRSIEKTQD